MVMMRVLSCVLTTYTGNGKYSNGLDTKHKAFKIVYFLNHYLKTCHLVFSIFIYIFYLYIYSLFFFTNIMILSDNIRKRNNLRIKSTYEKTFIFEYFLT